MEKARLKDGDFEVRREYIDERSEELVAKTDN